MAGAAANSLRRGHGPLGSGQEDPLRPLPPRRVVFRFDIPDGERPRYWLLLQRPRAEVCATAPGFDVDLAVTTTSEWLAKWHTGAISLGHAMRGHLMHVEGPRDLERKLASWGGLGTLAPPVAESQRTTEDAAAIVGT